MDHIVEQKIQTVSSYTTVTHQIAQHVSLQPHHPAENIIQQVDITAYLDAIDRTTLRKIDHIIQSDVQPYIHEGHGKVVEQVSSDFVGTSYVPDTMIGGPDTPEIFVTDIDHVDCFTLIDNVESLSRSHDASSFLRHLIDVRYVNGEVSYSTRRHFFSDWFATQKPNARDVTLEISKKHITVEKWLNRKPDGTEYLPGLGVTARNINYIPAKAIDDQVLNNLKTGDYVGVYSPAEGLDVSHVGIVVRHDGEVWFRNASSLEVNRKVVDSPFMAYMHAKPGIVVLRSVRAES
ncbi:MAG: N-acetylmuramoyl-L-alanine amidase-like domain-containing protein [Plesiomonas sp.]|uniref:N-acetylmuramoyl-L-alanine amidase-like domain-containing protein n=1 Tax=Plesiomonas sp. TaxID=2486279 RepID=UPI003F2B4375